MPVQRGALRGICDSIFDGNVDNIAPVCLYWRSGKAPIYKKSTLLETIWGYHASSNDEFSTVRGIGGGNIVFVRIGVRGRIVLSGCVQAKGGSIS